MFCPDCEGDALVRIDELPTGLEYLCFTCGHREVRAHLHTLGAAS